MSELTMSICLVVMFFFLLGSGIWVAFSLMAVGMAGMALFTEAPLGEVLATTVWGASNSWALAALPLFIWMGEILFRSRLAEDMFTGLAPWLTYLPGRLLHVNILGCGIFAAVSGSSAATAATIGKMSIPELAKRNYPKNLIIGTLAGSATLGLLIPPSIILIVYGVATEQSIARLFIAGVLPGCLLMALFVGYVMLWSLLYPDKIPAGEAALPLKEKIMRARRLIPVMLLIGGVIGSIYSGIASPTDAAAVGVLLALVLSWYTGTLSKQTFLEGLIGATKTSCMIAFILAGAAFLTVAMGFTGIPKMLAGWIGTLELSPYALLGALTIFFIILGCFLDGISVVVLTTSVIMPMIEQAGIDPLWFGIFVVIVVEMSQITPPVGFNLFVIQGLTGMNILKVAYAAAPFFLLLLAGLGIIVMVPEIVTLLPDLMSG
ncbi:MAG: C4-dicarboxylate ABC transporter permease [Desulfobulbaceae bacterium S3730MH12]|nr:MAG: C4-dicarboxylate ABC transporter permease [Desulfobulbaceae bacterium S5133MH15]OEU58136.1 MAG: C4-dicarboxylate ABC transporter permease [Desulfobulbaceae bacterium S3730MH12]OEU82423.1 MAG: C4-dicarboxylate ABC transporter permease [Desulfobulbaceae bacterium C00003063]